MGDFTDSTVAVTVDACAAATSALGALLLFFWAGSETPLASEAAAFDEARVGVGGMLFLREASSVSLLSSSIEGDSCRKSGLIWERTGVLGVEVG